MTFMGIIQIYMYSQMIHIETETLSDIDTVMIA